MTFIIATVALLGAVTAIGYLIGTQGLPVSMKGVALFAVFAQVAVVVMRERAIKPKRRWRSWYTGALSVLAVSAIVAPTVWYGVDSVTEEMRKDAQVALGYHWLFFVLLLPVVLASLGRAKPVDRPSSDQRNASATA